MKLTPQQRLQVYRELENKLSLGITSTLGFFNENMDKVSEEKKKEFKKALDEMNQTLKALQMSVQNGKDGKDGKDGPKGDKGDSIVGPQGPAGHTPVKNKDYFDGEDSEIPGPQGPAGKDGSPDKPKEIADKLNTLDDAVDIKVIKGLLKRFEAVEKSIQTISKEKKGGGGKSGGGGMGNVQHESKPTTSATTTVATNYRIAANGFALWVYYQGQLLMRGVHYTVGADHKTLTLLFTPQDTPTTTIDIIYIRT